ncbi:MAG: DUF3987 domain-containing protein [Oligoflexales bacterium]
MLPLHYPLANGQCSCGKSDCQSPAKHPMTKNGLKNASAGPKEILAWWTKYPQANIGILTGQESGLVVLDIDPRHRGEESLNALEEKYGRLPETLKVRTGGDGWHYYFLHPGSKVPNRANLRNGVDIRGDGGYVVAPPSIHASFSSYDWVESETTIAPIPAWLLELIQKKQGKAKELEHHSPSFHEGRRNSSLFSLAGFLKSKGLMGTSISTALEAINKSLCEPPLEECELAQITKSISRYEEKEWSTPTELPPEVKAPTMDIELLPDGLRDWCLDISERMQVSLEFAAGPTVVALSSVIGRKATIYPKTRDDWQVTPNLWGVLIAPPGSMKSPAISAALKPIQSLAIKAREEFLEEVQRIEAEKLVAKAEIDALKDTLKSAVKNGDQSTIKEKKKAMELAVQEYEKKYNVTEKRYTMNDPTIEKLLSILQENPQGILLYRDELSGWMETMYKSGREGDREFFLESWNGDTPYGMDRIGRGSVFVDGLCLSVLGGLQPSKFQSYVAALAKGGKSDDGLLQRFQILLSPEKRTTWKRVDRQPNSQAAKKVENLFFRLANLPLPKRTEIGVERFSVHFSEDAQRLFDDWHENLEIRLLSSTSSPILENHLSKYRSLMPSLALIFELVSSLCDDSNLPEFVGSQSAELAIKWCAFLEQHAQKSYGEYIDPEMAGARRLLEKIRSGIVKDFERSRDIYRNGWKGLASQTELDDALKTLTKYGWARSEIMSPPTGRRYEVIRLHPSLRLV